MPRKRKAYPSLESAVRNITAVFSGATAEEWKTGKIWYRDAHTFAQGLSYDTDIPLDVVCHVIAVLSPSCNWNRNKADAEAVCWEFCKTEDVIKTRVSTYGPNLAKARLILGSWKADTRWDNILSGPKVTAFAANLLDPTDPFNVTLDTHGIAIAMGWHFTVSSVPELRPDVLERYRRAYRLVAREQGLVPCELQAIVWTTWRKQWYHEHETVLRLKGEEI